MRLATMLSETPGPNALGSLRDAIKAAADDGFSSAWMANIFGLDAITALAVAGAGIADIELGTGVVPTYPRHPVTMAQQAITAQLALEGRFTLGIGLSHQFVIEQMFGMDYAKPARHMSDYLDVLLPLLDGTPAAHTGTVSANVTVSADTSQPVQTLIAALAPQMLKLAATKAAGTVLWMAGAEAIRSHIVPSLQAANPDRAHRVVAGLPVCVTDDVEGTRAKADQIFAIYGQLPAYRAVLDRGGVAGPGALAIVGDEDAVEAGLREVIEAGATDVMAAGFATPGSTEAARTSALLRRLIADG